MSLTGGVIASIPVNSDDEPLGYSIKEFRCKQTEWREYQEKEMEECQTPFFDLMMHISDEKDKIYLGNEELQTVYFLWHHDEIVYIGVTKKLLCRLRGHCQGKDSKIFDSFSFIHVPDDSEVDANNVERRLIGLIKPKYNKTNSRWCPECYEKDCDCSNKFVEIWFK
jgi:predicted GIY-YIG superfamily endonuclease